MSHESFVAHGPDHSLVDHLREVGARAAAASSQTVAPLAGLAGLWHDLG